MRNPLSNTLIFGVYLMDTPPHNIVIRRVNMFYNMLNYDMTDTIITMCNVQAVVREEFIQLRYRIIFIND